MTEHDHGPDGPAALARPLRVDQIDVRITATRSAKREVRRYIDVFPFDQLHVAGFLSDREYDAGCRIYALFILAGGEGRSTPRYAMVRETVEAEWEDGGETQDEAPEDQYRRILSRLSGDRGNVLDSLLRHLLPAWRFGVARLALDELADVLGLESQR